MCYHSSMQVLVTFFLSALMTLALVHILALKFFLYWKYTWLDIPVHVLGGVCVALGFSILPYLRINLPSRYATFFAYMTFVLLVGLAWEVFEIMSGMNSIDEYFLSDTLLDLSMDLCGGWLGYTLMRRIITM